MGGAESVVAGGTPAATGDDGAVAHTSPAAVGPDGPMLPRGTASRLAEMEEGADRPMEQRHVPVAGSGGLRHPPCSPAPVETGNRPPSSPPNLCVGMVAPCGRVEALPVRQGPDCLVPALRTPGSRDVPSTR